jgi:uncharacterized glyoxalase superfamily protein PhnB
MAARKKAKKAAPKKKAKKAVAKKKVAKKVQPKRKFPETLRLRSVSPGLTVGDLQKSVAWYRDVLGFVVGEEWKRDGRITGYELMAGAARVFLGQDDWAKGRDRVKGVGFRLHLATAQNVDDIAANAKKMGGRLDSEPETMPWGARAFAITDPDGFKLTISSE